MYFKIKLRKFKRVGVENPFLGTVGKTHFGSKQLPQVRFFLYGPLVKSFQCHKDMTMMTTHNVRPQHIQEILRVYLKIEIRL